MKKLANYKFDFTENFMVIFELSDKNKDEIDRAEKLLYEIGKTFYIKNLQIIFRDYNGELTHLITNAMGDFLRYESPPFQGLLNELLKDIFEMRTGEYEAEKMKVRVIKGFI